ncbi:MAG: YesL family protein [Eubacteriales bacterium]|nr:YesL family protein [Eubacteriales bacterium]
MFSKWMNSFYYGKSGKGDYTPENLPTNRWQLFWEMLRVRLSALVRLNLMYVVPWLPTMIVLMIGALSFLTSLNNMVDSGEAIAVGELLGGVVAPTLLLLVPCITITGPFTSGVCYVTRNWARDEHAFIWSDFKDAVKENWKQSLVISFVTSLVPLMLYVCWNFYGAMANSNAFMVVPQVLTMMIGLMWCLGVTYFHPLIVSYKLRMRDVMRNGLLLAVARLPMSIGLRLLHALPMIIGVVLMLFVSPMYCMLGLFAYYLLIGFSLSRFVTASYTNAVFDKYINAKIEGAVVNRGLYVPDDDDDDDEENDDRPAADDSADPQV